MLLFIIETAQVVSTRCQFHIIPPCRGGNSSIGASSAILVSIMLTHFGLSIVVRVDGSVGSSSRNNWQHTWRGFGCQCQGWGPDDIWCGRWVAPKVPVSTITRALHAWPRLLQHKFDASHDNRLSRADPLSRPHGIIYLPVRLARPHAKIWFLHTFSWKCLLARLEKPFI